MDVKRLLAMLAAGALLGCSDSTAPEMLLGRWAAPAVDIGAGYSREEKLDFRSDGILEHRMVIYRSGQVDATYDFSYVYVVRNDSLFTAYPASPDIANWAGTRFNAGRLQVDGFTLTITYPWFGPADEPVTVTQVFLRERCRPMWYGCI